MSDVLTFDEASHTYTYGGSVVPGVTRILDPLTSYDYAGVAADVMARAASLGKAVHRLIELDLHDDLDEHSLSPDLERYFHAWRTFRQLSRFVCTHSETKVHAHDYGYAGQLDMAGFIGKRACIIDAKRTYRVPRSAGPQTAAYTHALVQSGDDRFPTRPQDVDRYALWFKRDATMELVPCREPGDFRVFLACKTLYDYRMKP